MLRQSKRREAFFSGKIIAKAFFCTLSIAANLPKLGRHTPTLTGSAWSTPELAPLPSHPRPPKMSGFCYCLQIAQWNANSTEYMMLNIINSILFFRKMHPCTCLKWIASSFFFLFFFFDVDISSKLSTNNELLLLL